MKCKCIWTFENSWGISWEDFEFLAGIAIILLNTLDFTSIIDDRLSRYSSLAGWLNSNYGISYYELSSNNESKLQYTRLCWMQSMYEEFLAKDE